jgi:hypothetical protein
MWPAASGFLVLSLLVFFVGVRSAMKTRKRTNLISPRSGNESTKAPSQDLDKNQENPTAMAMAAGTGNNSTAEMLAAGGNSNPTLSGGRRR